MEQVLRLLQSDRKQFLQATHQLKLLPRDTAVAIIKTLAGDADGEMRSRALDCMTQISDSESRLLARNQLDDCEWFVRANALHYMIRNRVNVNLSSLQKILKCDDDETVRCMVAHYMGVIGDKTMVPALEYCIANDLAVDHEGTPISRIARRSIERINNGE